MNKELLESFTQYCDENPEQRFWQALRNWAGVSFLCVKDNDTFQDTFYWQKKNEQ